MHTQASMEKNRLHACKQAKSSSVKDVKLCIQTQIEVYTGWLKTPMNSVTTAISRH